MDFAECMLEKRRDISVERLTAKDVKMRCGVVWCGVVWGGMLCLLFVPQSDRIPNPMVKMINRLVKRCEHRTARSLASVRLSRHNRREIEYARLSRRPQKRQRTSGVRWDVWGGLVSAAKVFCLAFA